MNDFKSNNGKKDMGSLVGGKNNWYSNMQDEASFLDDKHYSTQYRNGDIMISYGTK